MGKIKYKTISEYPELMKEWSPRNAFSPSNITIASRKKPIWRCEFGHEWEVRAIDRIKYKTGCPVCTRRIATPETSLVSTHPKIAQEWHPTKNTLDSTQVLYGSTLMIWWLCPKGHEYKMSPNSRTNQKQGCPFCSGKRVDISNCLTTTHPDLIKEWHPTKNGELTPYDVTKGSHLEPWWICPWGHEYQATIHNRTLNDTKCLKCFLENCSGPNSPNWRGGISFEPYSPEFNNQLKSIIRERDNFTCQLCGITEQEHQAKYHKVLCPHHIDYNKKNCSLDNLITLCHRCNIKANYGREYWAIHFQEVMLNKYIEAVLSA